jgi:hypothetical protein
MVCARDLNGTTLDRAGTRCRIDLGPLWFVGRGASNVARIDRVDISSGARTRVREIRLSERGVIFVWVTDYRSDGADAYMYWQQPSTVFEIGGLDVR